MSIEYTFDEEGGELIRNKTPAEFALFFNRVLLLK